MSTRRVEIVKNHIRAMRAVEKIDMVQQQFTDVGATTKVVPC